MHLYVHLPIKDAVSIADNLESGILDWKNFFLLSFYYAAIKTNVIFFISALVCHELSSDAACPKRKL